MAYPTPELVLSFDPMALERCYLAADILYEDHGESRLEYALLGLSSETDPFNVVATPLLPDQRVTEGSVEQSGHGVFRLRREIDRLSDRTGRRLVPIAFVHRHPSQCDASSTDKTFLAGVFIDQVATVVSFEEVRRIGPGPGCGCVGMERMRHEVASGRGGERRIRLEYGICFSLIVNQERDHRLYAVRKDTCPLCGTSAVRYVPARLARAWRGTLSPMQREVMREQLAREMAAKLVVDRGEHAIESLR